jgi:hypothetical protein
VRFIGGPFHLSLGITRTHTVTQGGGTVWARNRNGSTIHVNVNKEMKCIPKKIQNRESMLYRS